MELSLVYEWPLYFIQEKNYNLRWKWITVSISAHGERNSGSVSAKEEENSKKNSLVATVFTVRVNNTSICKFYIKCMYSYLPLATLCRYVMFYLILQIIYIGNHL